MMEKMKITLRTVSPVVLTGPGNSALLTVTRDTFGGTVLRGLVAARYIERNGKGENAHEDTDFRRFFFGGVRFVDAYPEKEGVASIPLPASLQKDKTSDAVLDLFDNDPQKGYKALRGLGVVTDGNRLSMVSVLKGMTLHMSRSGELPGESNGENGGNHAVNTERLSGKSEEGHLFNYESINEGQRFAGFLIGERKDLEDLRSAIGERWIGRAGRSKYVEYGEVECTLGGIEPLDTPSFVPDGNDMHLRLQTSLLPLDGNASNAMEVLKETVAREMNIRRATNAFSIGKIFANSESVDNFVGVWRLRRPRQTALSAGSCFALHKDGAWDSEDIEALRTLMYEGVGLRTEEGFGQLRFWPKAQWTLAAKQDELKNGQTAVETRKIANDNVKSKAEAILRGKRMENYRLYAAEDVKNSRASIAKHPAHVFSRLDGILLSEKDMTAETFKARLNAAKGEKGTAFSKHLEQIEVKLSDGWKSLHELLLSNPTLPYANKSNDMDEEIRALCRDIGADEAMAEKEGDVFREYWHWFFRHARKVKTSKTNVPKETEATL